MKNRKKSPSRARPIALIVIGLVLLIASGVILILDPFDNETPAGTKTAAEPNIPYPEVDRIEPEVAKNALDSGNAIFVDTRSQAEWTEGSILGSINIPVDQIDARMGELDKDRWIITFCT